MGLYCSLQKVFPESASLANSSKQIGSSDLPSDDSEDNDYDPTLAEGNMVDENKSSAEDGDEGSDSDDSDFMTTSDHSEPSMKKRSESKNKNTVDDLGLPSEDSEDDDFDPEGPDSSEDQKQKQTQRSQTSHLILMISVLRFLNLVSRMKFRHLHFQITLTEWKLWRQS